MIKNRKAVCALFLCMTAVLTFLVPPIQAVENKGKSMSAVETLMHSDQNIMELDGMLNHSYRAAMRAVSDRKKLKQEQIAWLKKVRNVCKTTDCLEDVYCDRINEFHDLEIKELGVIDKPLTDDEVKAIFRTLAKLADNGELSLMAVPGKAFSRLDEADKRAGWWIDPLKLKKITDYYGYSEFEDWGPDVVFKLRLNPESEPVLFGKFWYPGSCPNSEIFDFSTDIDMMVVQENKEVESKDVSKVESNLDQNEEDPDKTAESFEGDDGTEGSYWADWGGNDYPIVYRGRYFIVTSDYRNKNHLLQIDWPTRGLFLCKDSHKAVISSDIESLSSGVVTGKIKPLTFKSFKVKNNCRNNYPNITMNGAAVPVIYRWISMGTEFLKTWASFIRKFRAAAAATPSPG